MSRYLLIFLSPLFFFCQSQTDKQNNKAVSLKKEFFGKLPDGQIAELYTFSNASGMTIKIATYGGIITHVLVPDRNGNVEDVVLGYDSLSGYLKESPYFGALIGRYGNRIAKGKFTLDGKTYSLAVNNGSNHLHGGLKGFDKVLWKAYGSQTDSNATLRLSYLSKDGEEGYPGNLSIEVSYTLTNDNSLTIDYQANTNKATFVNLTNHTYFNLSGNTKNDILRHKLTLNASHFLPVDSTLIPTGVLQSVKNTPFDFTSSQIIGKRIDEKDVQLKFGNGYDHCWILDKTKPGALQSVGILEESVSGRKMEIFTTEPAIQFYSGNFLDGKIKGKGNMIYNFRQGLCLETQHYPDSPNKHEFPSTLLTPGKTYRSQTIYKFSVK
ncbi:MAG: galactose mutarotase [Verrucomicrobia bacterium]|nr:galactose mutarotase [Cytophagales bacterium]